MAVIGSEMSDDWFGITDFVSYSNLIEPNTQNAELYNKGYRTFRQTYQALVEV
jgi:xylulokinase